MQEIIDRANERVSKFNMMDWTLLKTCIMLVGVIFGYTFSDECKKLRPIIFIVWIACFHYLMFKIYFAPDKK
ncbi:hypothetical protein AN639_09285 [Candidatus Epulonipiscium fishelsonii]|uniref:Uncharacterized protein n=1 Tax=Candidatus Epulonipiscium fishelsonii TaxID=77094 RepID=A0ACC8XDR0_9FIRM|nr:hypothetical protein AN639_09285 [Epulopiscium sp. SCG-B05WGA-EpuloA1]ONI41036.1 hypothetical protein AN396_04570 [Epulopiscium sp. SCG-B11WGA-EpuloA1]